MSRTPQLLRLLLVAVLSLSGIGLAVAAPRLNIQITGGVEAAQPIAVVPFGVSEGLIPPVDIASIVSADLARTGKFRPMPTRDMLDMPSRHEEVDLRDWSLLGVNNLVIGRVEADSAGFRVSVALYDVFRGNEITSETLVSTKNGMRATAHRIADLIYEKLTGQKGVASTRIAYITSTGSGDSLKVTLRVADADGYNPQTIVSSSEPIMSPAWSPDGRRLAYVSFENKRPAIYVQELNSGRRELVASYPGINGSPAFSPDGTRLAMTLSKDGNPDIYTLNMLSRELVRLTDHYAIDTEPAWSPDGRSIIFTSDRGGSPQIYRMPASGGPTERVSIDGDYNARASYSPDGRSIVMVTRVNGSFRIAVLDTQRGITRLLSKGDLDESPSFAPNGSMVIYATTSGSRGVLAAASVEGGGGQRLSQDSGQVREPAWSHFMR
ncbi:Tol-Pal system beta propeller repeat protein TolB [Thiorhodococcus mannitoliphagus]|uniref:Tol-Pal system protein TolB n=1 Tax=Thiorhodococcus mannitoliphagus TaxID=329406 RepID=A0A6P1DNH8_9GAMM|nr:Tol-Pal system beta propeller repeat protein TolB [Thiorhodococcus mannitoliphagus]NEX19578.1 Tol-Pal system beta propeller repeat protein TolB [Thiorhodococcus mannitoliphagus]